ncbi:MAG: Rieske 2Fe-2S domain-containing protein [Rhodospirillales bacterium]|nr:Rieske 2Fe-2S domain-containing protein [Rhodospirillales bacterium]
MDGLMDDRAVARRVLEHIDRGTTDLGAEVWREPVDNYRSPERLAGEIERVMRRFPTPFCPSASLPEAGSYVAREAAGTPIVAVRGEDGEVRAFRNACRHRGMQVATGTGCSRTLVCRYHGWVYRLDGRLSHLPGEDGFPGFDKEAHGLVPVGAVERGGVVWVTQDPGPAGVAPADDVPALLPDGWTIFSVVEREMEANWKLVMEGFIEGYHIRATHKDTFYPYGFDNLNVIETFGRNSRVTYPFRRIRKLADVPDTERRVDGLLTYVYQLFPNAMVAALSRHAKLVVLEPVGVARTRMVTWTLGDPAVAEEVKRDAAFVDQTGGAEDREVVQAIQRALGSGANDVFTFGKFESAVAHFHRTLGEALAAA